jgi:hypothetical protein
MRVTAGTEGGRVHIALAKSLELNAGQVLNIKIG